MPIVEDIGHIVLRVGDMDKALRLYRDILGFGTPEGVNPVWTVLTTKGGSITLWKDANPVPCVLAGNDTPLNFHVADFSEAARTVEAEGYVVRRTSSSSGSVTDPWGNVVGLHDHRET